MAAVNTQQVDECPKDLIFNEIITTLQCHPTHNIVACGQIGGNVLLQRFSPTSNGEKLHKFVHHKKACRALRFSSDGRRLFSASKDKSIYCVDVETGKLKRKIKKAHESPIYSMVQTGDTFVATGDDDGVLKVWDMRSKQATMELKECEEFISDMIVEDNKIIIAASGEGTLTAFNIRRKRMDVQSELFDSELLCLAKMKGGHKLVCGTGEGVLNVFNWGEWGNISDRFPCDKEQIDSVVPITDDVLCIGTNNGFVRAVHVLPNRVLGLVGQHTGDFPVEALSLTADKTCIASCSHDQLVKFWNIEELKTQTVDTSKKASKNNKRPVHFSKSKNFFAGLVEASDEKAANGTSDDDESDSDDSE
ncbi:WD repeat-containing protein 55-like isoform X1 [Biomphalaria glabrata]|uniref:WD repeat-containing protein 55-like isoform X1 n=1 Tax=Biomphalaria glabrata TaxID=6526 RepID=A0A9U8E6Y1_BIOGL|nr:WD repeat-containing protein 55-like isoform X1 [Biomphalaria glabrata]